MTRFRTIVCLALTTLLGACASGSSEFEDITFISAASGKNYTLTTEETSFLNQHLKPYVSSNKLLGTSSLLGTCSKGGDDTPCRLRLIKHSSHPVYFYLGEGQDQQIFKLESDLAHEFYTSLRHQVR